MEALCWFVRNYERQVAKLGGHSPLNARNLLKSIEFMRSATILRCLAVSVLSAVIGAGGAVAESAGVNIGRANQEQTAEAIAHFARSRALLVAALNEFDRGRKIARPDDLLDPVKWRNTLIDRAEDLERVLDPQPKATKGGIKFSADPRLLPEAKK